MHFLSEDEWQRDKHDIQSEHHKESGQIASQKARTQHIKRNRPRDDTHSRCGKIRQRFDIGKACRIADEIKIDRQDSQKKI